MAHPTLPGFHAPLATGSPSDGRSEPAELLAGEDLLEVGAGEGDADLDVGELLGFPLVSADEPELTAAAAEREPRRASGGSLAELADDVAWLGLQLDGMGNQVGEIRAALRRLEHRLENGPPAGDGASVAQLLDALERSQSQLEDELEKQSTLTRKRFERQLARAHLRLMLLASAALLVLALLLARSFLTVHSAG